VLDNMLQLVCHPDTPSKTVIGVEVTTELSASGALWFRFYVDGVLDKLETLAPAEPLRTDGLWETTCFEAFLGKPGEAGYCEYNFAPSGAWAAYQFNEYRAGGRDLVVDEMPEIFLDASETHLAAEVTINVPAHLLSGPIDLNLTAVIEETDGTKSYWALAHPNGKPDFHHRDCFTFKLLPPEAA
jgi:hypothetical protein